MPSRPYQTVHAPSPWSTTRASSKPSPQATYLSVCSPIVDQKPGATSHSASSPAIVAARDLAHVERLAPVLDREVALRGGVVGERDVARGVDALGGRAHLRVDDDAAVLVVEAGGLGEPGAGLDAGGHQDQLGQRSRRARCSPIASTELGRVDAEVLEPAA